MNSVGPFLELVAAFLDADALQRLRELDPDNRNGIVERVLRTYQKSLGTSLQSFEAAAGDAEQLRRLAHTLKSSSASVGALRLSALCAEVEHLARLGHPAELGPAVERLRAEGQQLRDALAPLLAH